MKYYKISHDIEAGHNDENLWPVPVTHGMPTNPVAIMKDNERVDFVCPYPVDELTDFPNNAGIWLLVSLRLEKILLPYIKKSFLVTDSRIIHESTGSYREYRLLHGTVELNGIDKNKTLYCEFPEQHQVERVIRNFELRKSKLAGHHLFRVKGLNGYYFVSEQLKQEIESEGISGMEFEEADAE